jgi:hypothetical protein
MLAAIAAGLQIALLLLSHWFKASDEKKEAMKEILKEVPSAKDVGAITHIFDRINRLS